MRSRVVAAGVNNIVAASDYQRTLERHFRVYMHWYMHW